MTWPCRHPYSKRWFQRRCAAQFAVDRRARVAALIAKWEPRLWAVSVNLPDCLLAESRYLSQIERDWRPFPAWVREAHEKVEAPK